MRKTILLKSRYGETHRLERIGEKDSHLFLFIPSDSYYRLGFSGREEAGYNFVDPSGGPFITVGSEIDGHVVKAIHKSGIVEFES